MGLRVVHPNTRRAVDPGVLPATEVRILVKTRIKDSKARVSSGE